MKFIRIKGPRETLGTGLDEKISPGGRDLRNFGNLPQGCGDIIPEKYDRPVLCLVYCISDKIVSFENQKSLSFLSRIILQ